MTDHTLLLGDCREVLRHIPDRSVHLCVTDPPYFIDGMGDDWSEPELVRRRSSATARTSCVRNLPPVMPFHRDQGRRLHEFMLPIAVELGRILVPGAFVVSFSMDRLAHRMACAIEDAGLEIRGLWGWQHDGQPKAQSLARYVRFLGCPQDRKDRLVETMRTWKTVQPKPQYEPMVVAMKPIEGTFVENWDRWGVGLMNIGNYPVTPFPGTLLPFDTPTKDERGGREHLTPKPVALIAEIVRRLSQPGQTVIDPFMGSGSHGEATIACGRRFIGIERDNGHYQHAVERIGRMGS